MALLAILAGIKTQTNLKRKQSLGSPLSLKLPAAHQDFPPVFSVRDHEPDPTVPLCRPRLHI